MIEQEGKDTIVFVGPPAAEMLTSDNPGLRIIARGASAGWLEAMSAWVNAELQRPELDTAMLLDTWFFTMLQAYSSIAAQICDCEHDEAIIAMMHHRVDSDVRRHMAIIRQKAGRA